MKVLHCIHLKEWDERLLHVELTPADRVLIHQFNKGGSTGILFTYNRLNHHYRPAHELCWLVLEQTGIEDFLTRGRTSCFSFLLNMNQLFEQFVTVLMRKLLEPHGFRVKSQHKDASISGTHSAIPDRPGCRAIRSTARGPSSVAPGVRQTGANPAADQ